MRNRIWLVCLVAMITTIVADDSNARVVASTPLPGGKYGVGTLETDWSHTFGNATRPLKIRVWYPAHPVRGQVPRPYFSQQEACDTIAAIEHALAVPAGSYGALAAALTHSYERAPAINPGHFPLVLFNHGYWFFLAQNTALMENLASHGYVVISVAHPGDSMRVRLSDGRRIDTDPYTTADAISELNPYLQGETHDTRVSSFPSYIGALRNHRITRSLQTWSADLVGALDDMQKGSIPDETLRQLAGRIDFSRVAFAGMSFGGAVAASACVSDARCDAVINLDGEQYDPSLFNRDIGKPLLLLQGDWVTYQVGQQLQQPDFNNEDYFYESFDRAAAAPDVHRVRVAQLRHLGFTDLPLFASPAERQRTLGALNGLEAVDSVNDAVLGFLQRYLKGQTNAYPGHLFQNHPGLIARNADGVRAWRHSATHP